MASEEMSFENVDDDDGRTTYMYAWLYYKLNYEPSASIIYIIGGLIIKVICEIRKRDVF